MMTTGGPGEVIATRTRLSRVRGEDGRLTCAGYDIEDLAEHATFEAVCHLLWNGSLPDEAGLSRLSDRLRAEMVVDDHILEIVRTVCASAHPMAVLRTAISAAGCTDPDAGDATPAAERRKAVRLTARAFTLSAAIGRFRSGLQTVAPRPDLGVAANFLYMLSGRVADPAFVRALDVALVLHAEHGMNPSTFTARLVAATKADMHSAVVAAIGALKGPLHGGANETVIRMLLEIGSADRAEGWIDRILNEGRRVPGFGHHEYRTIDPRAPILEGVARDLHDRSGNATLIEIAERVREVMTERMSERGKPVHPNVDFYSAPVYYALGIQPELFPNLFACARMAGWTAHVMEQRIENRMIRPVAEYTGPAERRIEPIPGRA
jgi:citrate synthase